VNHSPVSLYPPLIFDGKDFYRIPAYKPGEVVDATGCGDTYTIGYLYQRVSGAGIEEAGRFAAAMSTLKIEKSGPFNGSKEVLNGNAVHYPYLHA
jgi:sugar/nucleoside kinase (ribokinase family)